MYKFLKAENMKVHWWIWIYGALTILGSSVGVMSGFGQFELFYAAAVENLDTTHPVVAHLGGMWATKNIAYIVAILAGFIFQKPMILATVFGMKFVNDTIDMFFIGPAHLDQDVTQILIGWLILGLPSALAAFHLIRRA